MIAFIKKITGLNETKNYVSPEEFRELKDKFESKKKELLLAIKKATEDKDITRQDILLKELSENERKFEEVRMGLWKVARHPNRLSETQQIQENLKK